jgi:hypothetical protein
MMRKALGILLLICALTIYIASSSKLLMQKVVSYKFGSTSELGTDEYRFGDLYGMSRLEYFRKNYRTVPIWEERKICKKEKDIDLYMFCDSYVWVFAPDDSFYCGVNKLQFATNNYREYLTVKLDSTKKNILLMEFVERDLIPDLQYSYPYLSEFLSIDSTRGSSVKMDTKKSSGLSIAKVFSDFKTGLFNPNINSNIKFLVWETALFTPVRELRASVNYRLFDKIDKEVQMGPDHKYLLYNQTVDTSMESSSFRDIPDFEIDTFINKLNRLASHYRACGFKEIYLSIIPNPVTILYPQYEGFEYNNLIPRIEHDSRLKMKVVDVYDDFKVAKNPIYQFSDTHWNRNGVNIWLNNLNAILSEY